MSSTSVRECPLSLCGIVLYLCAGISSTSVRGIVLCVWECPLPPLCPGLFSTLSGISSTSGGNVLYLCAGLFSTFVREYPLPR
ncbi:hypothetical protein CDAR_367101 [Caerostris darwini]|uniref:Secreted protein n=1 Tax=Caerostris darwini TaxID=1538125 RepID=A0AAV4WP22_9ARAC|nr:hypothetical protein CDAR_367101 [Caerostris darwini]